MHFTKLVQRTKKSEKRQPADRPWILFHDAISIGSLFVVWTLCVKFLCH
jgi:hypothetical protein